MSQKFGDLIQEAAGLATGWMGWLPDQFWQATPAEFRTAVNARFGGGAAATALSRTQMQSLMEKLGHG